MVRLADFLGGRRAGRVGRDARRARAEGELGDAQTLTGHDAAARVDARRSVRRRPDAVVKAGDGDGCSLPPSGEARRQLLLADADARLARAVVRGRRRASRRQRRSGRASQATHRLRQHLRADSSACREDKVRVVYLDGAGCYGMNGHDDAAADAALISKALGRPVRVQWTREDEHGWDPKGPPQLLDARAARSAPRPIAAWEAEMWLPAATANLPNIPLLGPRRPGSRSRRGCRRRPDLAERRSALRGANRQRRRATG